MRWKLFGEFCITILVIYFVAGDLFLPQPYRSESQQLRSNINHFLVGLFPHKKIIDVNPRSKVTPP